MHVFLMLVIWDIQTGGVAKEIEYGSGNSVALAWSLDGSTIGLISHEDLFTHNYTVYIYNVASGMMHSPGTLPSTDVPCLFAYDTSFRVMATAQGDVGLIIDVFEVGPVLTKIESFRIEPLRGYLRVESFSHSTYRISISVGDDYFVFDIRTSHRLLSAKGLGSHSFSSNGSLFGGVSVSGDTVHIWKYTSGGYYTPWREFPLQGSTLYFYISLQFSPTSSLLLARCGTILRLWRLDGPPIVTHPSHRIPPLITLSRCGSYVVTGCRRGSIVTITNLLSQTSPHSIDTGMWIHGLALTGNLLLVLDSSTIAAWRLIREETVDGIFIDGRAGCGDRIWTVSLSDDEPILSFVDQTVVIRRAGMVRTYCTETGEVLEPTRTLLDHHEYSFQDMLRGLHHPHYHDIDPYSIMQTSWMKDPEGKYRLWTPVEWRNSLEEATLSDDFKTLRFDLKGDETILIKF